jgi:hypothetical protein
MKVGKLSMQFAYVVIGAFTLVGAAPSRALAQHDHGTTSQHQTPEQKKREAALVQAVREATEDFKDPAAAEAAGYHLAFGCVSGADFGAMGLHFVNMNLVGDAVIDVNKPEIILYEATSSGKLRITGADFLVLADAWNAANPDGPPQLMGQLFHLFDAPNRFGLPAFYTLHVWAWKDNPNGTYVNWNPNVSCDGFKGDHN